MGAVAVPVAVPWKLGIGVGASALLSCDGPSITRRGTAPGGRLEVGRDHPCTQASRRAGSLCLGSIYVYCRPCIRVVYIPLAEIRKLAWV